MNVHDIYIFFLYSFLQVIITDLPVPLVLFFALNFVGFFFFFNYLRQVVSLFSSASYLLDLSFLYFQPLSFFKCSSLCVLFYSDLGVSDFKLARIAHLYLLYLLFY